MSRFVFTIDRPLNDDFLGVIEKLRSDMLVTVIEFPTPTTALADFSANSVLIPNALSEIKDFISNNLMVDDKAGEYGNAVLVDLEHGNVFSYDASEKEPMWIIQSY